MVSFFDTSIDKTIGGHYASNNVLHNPHPALGKVTLCKSHNYIASVSTTWN